MQGPYSHNKSKGSHQYESPRIEEIRKYVDFAENRKRNLLNLNFDNNEGESNISLSQIGRVTPLVFNRKSHRNFTGDNKDGIIINNSAKKEEIKGKIKVRIKAEIESLIKKNTFSSFKKKRIEPNQLLMDPINNGDVSIIGASVVYPWLRDLYDKENMKIKNMRKSVLSQIAFDSRKVKSSLENRPTTRELLKKQQMGQFPLYRRSLSTDIRLKNKNAKKELQKQKEESIQPWHISNYVDEEQHF